MSSDLTYFLYGAIALTCFAIGVKFLKYWQLSRDRFFLWFTSAFWVFTIGWSLRLVVDTDDEHRHYLFVPRLIGFLLILIAILDKNRRAKE